jgi:hypothetical protein
MSLYYNKHHSLLYLFRNHEMTTLAVTHDLAHILGPNLTGSCTRDGPGNPTQTLNGYDYTMCKGVIGGRREMQRCRASRCHPRQLGKRQANRKIALICVMVHARPHLPMTGTVH